MPRLGKGELCLGEDGLRLGELESSLAGGVLPRLGKDELRPGEAVRLGEGRLCLGKPRINCQVLFSYSVVHCT